MKTGFSPIWSEECEFSVSYPDLAFLYFVVKDHSATGKDMKLGQHLLPFSALSEGITKLFTIFVNVQTLTFLFH